MLTHRFTPSFSIRAWDIGAVRKLLVILLEMKINAESMVGRVEDLSAKKLRFWPTD